MHLGEMLPLQEASVLLGVSATRLRQLLASGEMVGAKRANAWFVPALEARRWADLPRAPHRPFSHARAWRSLGLLARGEADPSSDGLAGRLHRRAARSVLYVHPRLLGGVAGGAGVVLGGVEAIERAGIAGDYPVRDVYLGSSEADSLIDRLGARPAVEALNLVLHVVDRVEDVPRAVDDRYVAAPVAALDLMEGYDPRIRALGRDLWQEHREGPP